MLPSVVIIHTPSHNTTHNLYNNLKFSILLKQQEMQGQGIEPLTHQYHDNNSYHPNCSFPALVHIAGS